VDTPSPAWNEKAHPPEGRGFDRKIVVRKQLKNRRGNAVKECIEISSLRQTACCEAIETLPPVLLAALDQKDRDPEVLHNLFGLVDD
jgi:hypothetical protein